MKGKTREENDRKRLAQMDFNRRLVLFEGLDVNHGGNKFVSLSGMSGIQGARSNTLHTAGLAMRK